MAADPPRLEVSDVSKTFGRTTVLRGATLSVRPGEVHGLLGQNGSGESTLTKILSGLHRPDPGGRILVDGSEVHQPISPSSTGALGLTFVHQSLGLLPGHTVAENIRLGQLRGRGWKHLIDWSHERSRALETLADLHADIDPDRLVDRLPMGERATVAIARALQSMVPGQGCIILDESTQSLPREVLPDFFATVRRLADAGTSVFIVSHRLDEVLSIADRVTVLRDGAVTASGLEARGLSEDQLAAVILGRQLVGFTPHQRSHTATGDAAAGDPARATVRLRGVSGASVAGLDLDLLPGEVVGVTGTTESGHEELPYLLAGVRQGVARGSLEVDGVTTDLAGAGVSTALRAGVALVPADRPGEGIAVTMTALENVTVPRVVSRSTGGVLRRRWQEEEFQRAVEELSITPADPDLEAASFSGGDQQKLLFAKWLLSGPRLLVLHEPTQAVDGAVDAQLHLAGGAGRGVPARADDPADVVPQGGADGEDPAHLQDGASRDPRPRPGPPTIDAKGFFIAPSSRCDCGQGWPTGVVCVRQPRGGVAGRGAGAARRASRLQEPRCRGGRTDVSADGPATSSRYELHAQDPVVPGLGVGAAEGCPVGVGGGDPERAVRGGLHRAQAPVLTVEVRHGITGSSAPLDGQLPEALPAQARHPHRPTGVGHPCG